MKLRALTIVAYWLAMAVIAHAQPLPAPQRSVVVEAPGVSVTAPQVRVQVPAPVVRVPPVIVEAEPPILESQPQAYQPQVSPTPAYQPPAPIPTPVGAVLVSRNWNERDNTSPGYWNHLAIYAGNGIVIESQAGIGVHEITWAEYRARPQNVVVVPPPTPEEGQAIAARAKALRGLPYWRLSSVTLFKRPLNRGLNCVSVAEASCRVSLRRPDNIFSWYPARAAGPLQ